MTQQTGQGPALDPRAVASDEGEARWWFGILAVIKTTAAETGGQLTRTQRSRPRPEPWSVWRRAIIG